MNFRYLATDESTDWKSESFALKVLNWVLKRLNPNYAYEKKFHLVRKWLIEFEDDDLPCREIGLDEQGSPVLWGPSDNVYGFWQDTNMTYDDFKGDPITKEYFEKHWDLAKRVDKSDR